MALGIAQLRQLALRQLALRIVSHAGVSKMNKFGKALIISLSLAGSAVIAPVVASAGVGVDITVAPPEPRVGGFAAGQRRRERLTDVSRAEGADRSAERHELPVARAEVRLGERDPARRRWVAGGARGRDRLRTAVRSAAGRTLGWHVVLTRRRA